MGCRVVALLALIGARTSAADQRVPLTGDLGATAGGTYVSSDVVGGQDDGFAPQLGVEASLGIYITPDVAIVGRARFALATSYVSGVSGIYAGAVVRYQLHPEWFVEAGPMYGATTNLHDDDTKTEATGLALDVRLGRSFGPLLIALETTPQLTHGEDVGRARSFDITFMVALFGRAH